MGARLHLVEQSHVFDRNHGLVGETGNKIDLAVGERPDLLPRQDEHADRRAFAQQRNAQHGAVIAEALVF